MIAGMGCEYYPRPSGKLNDSCGSYLAEISRLKVQVRNLQAGRKESRDG